jgi:hypothetical protein
MSTTYKMELKNWAERAISRLKYLITGFSALKNHCK